MPTLYYDRQGRIVDRNQFRALRVTTGYHRVAETNLPNDKRVSTIWTGLDYGSDPQHPQIFETLVLLGAVESEIDGERYSTEREALDGHKRMVEKHRNLSTLTRTKKVQVSFDASALEIIERLRVASGATSMAEVLRAALGFYDWAHEQIEAGYAVGAYKAGEPAKEVALFMKK
jgi:hypothetical protein